MAKRRVVEAPDTDVRDDQVLALREKGTSFSSIARRLELERPSAAIDAFKRAVKQRPAKERAKLQKAEFGRLDASVERVRNDAALTPEEVAAKLRTLDMLRAKVSA